VLKARAALLFSPLKPHFVMKRSLWLLLLFCWCGLYAQTGTQSFVITNPGTGLDVSAYEKALNLNELDKYRHMDHRTTMVFVEGVEVQLLSGKEMQVLGLPVDISAVNTTTVDRLQRSKFKLHSSGRIIELVTPLKKG
jgi:hypothetical protein